MEREALLDPEEDPIRMNSYDNPLEIPHSSFLDMKAEAGLHGYALKEVMNNLFWGATDYYMLAFSLSTLLC